MTDLWAKLKPRKQGLAPEQLAAISFEVKLPQQVLNGLPLDSQERSAFGCGFNRWVLHLTSEHREEDVADEPTNQDSLLRSR